MPPTHHLCRRHFLATLAAMPASGIAKPRFAAPALLLALDAPPQVDPAGFLVSEKLDGVRAFWDGRRLRFRSGLPILAPDWFIERLPSQPLDGELWLGRGRFEALSGVVRRAAPQTAAWQAISYRVFELPGAAGSFAARALALQRLARESAWPHLVAVDQAAVSSAAELQWRLDKVVQGGGEGLMLHRADAPYLTGRSSVLLKLKPLLDAEAVVTGHVAGRGKHEGRLGALRVRLADGSSLLIGTGFTDAQRERPPVVGSIVTFTFRGTTEAGVPRFASFLRERSL